MNHKNIKSYNLLIVLFGLLLVIPPTMGQKTTMQKPQRVGNNVTESLIISEQVYTDQSDNKYDNGPQSLRGKPKPPNSNVPSQFEIAGQECVKIFVNRDSWYLVSASKLTNAGFNINTDTAKWRLFADGVEVPIKINNDQSIEFYGKGKDTLVTDTTVYYLINGTSNGLRISEINVRGSSRASDTYNFPVKLEYKDRINYLSSILNGEKENWFGSVVNNTVSNFDLNIKNLASDGQASLKIKILGITYIQHLVNIRINNHDLGMASFSNTDLHEQVFNIPVSALNEGANRVTIQAFGSGNDISVLDLVSLTFPRTYGAINNKLHFSVPAGKTARVEGFTSGDVEIFEVTGGQTVNKLSVEVKRLSQTFGFNVPHSNYEKEYYAIAGSTQDVPLRVERNAPSLLNDNFNRAEFIVITSAELSSFAHSLANRREGEGLTTKVVLTEDIGDEFGYGVISPEAIKIFLEHSSNVWRSGPRYVLLLGDSSFDMRNYIGGVNRNVVPTKLIETFDMETSSDGWLVDFDGDGIENLAIGRIPVANAEEAERAVNKIIRYETTNTEHSKSAVLVADSFFEILNGALEDLLPNNVGSQRIERWYMSDAQMRQEILDKLNQNPTFVSYMGHGTPGVWRNPNVFTLNDTQELTNQKLSFYMLMTCLNGFTHNPYSSSLAENLVLSENGAIAAWASSGSTYASGQIQMGQDVVSLTFSEGNNNTRIGDIVKTAKRSSGDWDARRTWQLIGDPTLIIK